MIDEELLKRITQEAHIQPEDIILEIGSGKGALTKHLIGKGKKLICVEMDKRLPTPNKEVEYHNENILEIIDKLEFDIVVANIPYHISEPLLKKILAKKTKSMTLVTGETLAKKLLGESILGSIIRSVYEIKQVTKIQPTSFKPQPHVMSALIKLKKKSPEGLLATFYKFEKTKTKNYIIKITEQIYTKKEIKTKLEQETLGFEEKKLYELSTTEFLRLESFIENITK